MASLIAGSALLGATALSLGSNVLFSTANIRSFVSDKISFVAPCNITEYSSDDYVVTDHPTEMGVLISDHMFALPKRVEIELIYSISGNNYALKSLGSAIGIGGKPRTMEQYYKDFLKLQASRVPFDITTGKRQYRNMVINHLGNITKVDSENCLKLQISARSVIIVKSKVQDTSNSVDNANLSGTSNQGQVQAK